MTSNLTSCSRDVICRYSVRLSAEILGHHDKAVYLLRRNTDIEGKHIHVERQGRENIRVDKDADANLDSHVDWAQNTFTLVYR